MTAHATRAHARLSASASHRWMNCPASVRLSAGLPDTSSPYADEGTAAHQLSEFCLLNGWAPGRFEGWYVNLEPEANVGVLTPQPSGPRSIVVDEEMVLGVGVYVDWVLKLKELYTDIEITLETKVVVNEEYQIGGTYDGSGYVPSLKLLLVWDFKYGKGVAVEVQENSQGLIYGVGALKGTKRPIDEIALVIIQPRARHADGPVRKWTLDPIALMDFEADLLRAARRADDPDNEPNAGEWCRFCKAAATCPARRDYALAGAMAEFGLDGEMILPDATELGDNQLTTILDHIGQIEDWITKVRAYALARLTAGERVPGWKLVQKRAVRRWRDPQEATGELLKAGLKKDEILTQPELKSPAQLEKLLGKKAAKGFLEDLVVKESSGVTLAPEHDLREAVGADAVSEFGL